MPVIDKLSRSDIREIEATLTSEIQRRDRAAGTVVASQALTEALERLREGTYGQCIYCGNPIPAGRLLVIPETTHCLGCGSAA